MSKEKEAKRTTRKSRHAFDSYEEPPAEYIAVRPYSVPSAEELERQHREELDLWGY